MDLKNVPKKPKEKYPDSILNLLEFDYYFECHKSFFIEKVSKGISEIIAKQRAFIELEEIYHNYFGRNKYDHYESFRQGLIRYEKQINENKRINDTPRG